MTGLVMVTKGGGCGGGGGKGGAKGGVKSREEEQQNQISVLALLLAALRKSMVSCRVDSRDEVISSTLQHMEIGWPTNVRHITHVTFDRFNGFLGLPVEFQVEIPNRVPSASANVFGVSAESMQCSFDPKGNSVPTILLLMQERLYSQGGLKAGGIFRINPENGQEEHVLRCNTEEESVDLVKQLKPTEAALLNWAVGLMADVVEEEESNKMNARNIAMVFAPNMTRMSDPLTALMHAVQVMNLLKTLIIKTLRKREETAMGGYSPMSSHSCDCPTDEEFDSQPEMDTSCELRGPTSDYDNTLYSNCSADEDEIEAEVESLGEIEECFVRQPDEHKNITHSFFEEVVDESQRDDSSPRSCSVRSIESGVSFTDKNNKSSALCIGNGENIGDTDMVDKLDEPTKSDTSSLSIAG
ncbi:hypothetical protein ERO13_D11G123500v2 [Gossypium hirsutum]|uniref:Rho GTPase-activating protein 2 isoform X1 n=1 Tax=Gossypium hirsutum TaxID=3635 RepID=A0ABM3B4K0_GOSHI|nr:rho GTPase-activating protein 2-like isoform X1 [Gossypium hirsutum]KAG4120111.1 hypothetical protein ERO13_D11G123500v2 [Gossypium hirsutum]